jgi:hypothetical protein
MSQLVKNGIKVAIGIALSTSSLVWADPTSIAPEASVTSSNVVQANAGQEDVVKVPGGVQVKEGAGAGDTYNFYFQKSAGPTQVQQGGSSQQVSSPPPEVAAQKSVQKSPVEQSPPRIRTGRPVVDLLIGPINMPGRSGDGITLGADFFPENRMGLKLGGFIAAGETRSSLQMSSSATGTSESSSDTRLLGGSLAAAFNLLPIKQGKIGPGLGLLFVDERTKTKTTRRPRFGAEASSEVTSSTFRVLPYLELGGTISFSDDFGLNIALAVPNVSKYINFSTTFAWRI